MNETKDIIRAEFAWIQCQWEPDEVDITYLREGETWEDAVYGDGHSYSGMVAGLESGLNRRTETIEAFKVRCNTAAREKGEKNEKSQGD